MSEQPIDYERRKHPPITLTEEQLDLIAERAADRAVSKITEQVYSQIGKSVINKMIWIVGAASTGFYLWMQGKGDIK